MTATVIIASTPTLWLAPVGTAFPLVNAAPAAAWVRVGTSGNVNYDEDGVTVSHVAKREMTRSAGLTGPIKAFITEEDLIIAVKLLDVSLEQYATALNKLTPSTIAATTGVPGTKRLGLSQGPVIREYALLARGASPDGPNFVAQYQVPRCFQSGDAKPVYKKGKPATLDLEFTALEDLSAANEFERFGLLVSQHQAPL